MPFVCAKPFICRGSVGSTSTERSRIASQRAKHHHLKEKKNDSGCRLLPVGRITLDRAPVFIRPSLYDDLSSIPPLRSVSSNAPTGYDPSHASRANKSRVRPSILSLQDAAYSEDTACIHAGITCRRGTKRFRCRRIPRAHAVSCESLTGQSGEGYPRICAAKFCCVCCL